MWDELVKLILSYQILQMKQEIESFFIWDARKCIIRVFSLEVNNQLRKLMIIAKVLYCVYKRFPAYNSCKMSIWLAVTRMRSQAKSGVGVPPDTYTAPKIFRVVSFIEGTRKVLEKARGYSPFSPSR